jgi:chromosome segregation ATPase
MTTDYSDKPRHIAAALKKIDKANKSIEVLNKSVEKHKEAYDAALERHDDKLRPLREIVIRNQVIVDTEHDTERKVQEALAALDEPADVAALDEPADETPALFSS